MTPFTDRTAPGGPADGYTEYGDISSSGPGVPEHPMNRRTRVIHTALADENDGGFFIIPPRKFYNEII
ncbi:MAG: hypothetical protein JW746_07625 [Candidatus Krumholzibacteriota bacterium]|nr:hypothetical protein [Candidatus Krumholzibacteriota bacterium]